MFLERKSTKPRDEESMMLKLTSADPFSVHMTGESIDRIYKGGVLVEERVGHNLVVNSFLNLVMCLLKVVSFVNHNTTVERRCGITTEDSKLSPHTVTLSLGEKTCN